MKKLIIMLLILLAPLKSQADLFGGDLPLLANIVINTLHTMMELQRQTDLMNEEMRGITDRIQRIQAIADIVKPADWDQWKNPHEAVRRIRTIYHTLPKEYHSEKSDMIEEEIARAMNLISRVSPEMGSSFQSGKELERKGVEASPGVAQKLTASGVGTLISLESQSQVIQSHIVSLLAQVLADGNEKETRSIVSNGKNLNDLSKSINSDDGKFSSRAQILRIQL